MGGRCGSEGIVGSVTVREGTPEMQIVEHICMRQADIPCLLQSIYNHNNA